MAWNPCPRVPLRGPSGFVFGPPGGHKDRQMRSKKWAAWRPPGAAQTGFLIARNHTVCVPFWSGCGSQGGGTKTKRYTHHRKLSRKRVLVTDGRQAEGAVPAFNPPPIPFARTRRGTYSLWKLSPNYIPTSLRHVRIGCLASSGADVGGPTNEPPL